MIRLDGVTKSYRGKTVVKDLSLEIKEGETCVLLGPSGCGKSTTLRMINRLVVPDRGEIFIEGRNVKNYDLLELRRRIGYVIQSVGLFPHLTVAENVGILLKYLKWPKKKISQRVEELLALVRLDPDVYKNRYPHELSGGEAQRVGVARALAADPPILLMDEPFGALDPKTREQLQSEFANLKRLLKKTIVFVTHDVYEAVIMGDKIAILKDGELQQYAEPLQIWHNPANDFVASFVGAEFGFHVLSRFCLKEIDCDPVKDHSYEEMLLPRFNPSTNLKVVVAEMIRKRSTKAFVVLDGKPQGIVTFERIIDYIRRAGHGSSC